ENPADDRSKAAGRFSTLIGGDRLAHGAPRGWKLGAWGAHQLQPALIEVAMIVFAAAPVAGPAPHLFVEAVVPQPHSGIQHDALCHLAAGAACAFLPVVHVVLLEYARWTEHQDARQAERI